MTNKPPIPLDKQCHQLSERFPESHIAEWYKAAAQTLIESRLNKVKRKVVRLVDGRPVEKEAPPAA